MGDEREEMSEKDFEDMFKLTMEKKWKQVVEKYKNYPTSHKTKLTKSEETALHIAISTCNPKSPKYAIYIEQMIDEMEIKETLMDVLSMANVRGDTPLHLAAAVGSATICQWIASTWPKNIFLRNVNGETPLFIAAHHGNLQAFLCLHEVYREMEHVAELHEPLRRSKDGDTILHSAISGEYFKLAYQIISYYPKLVDFVNVEGESPLHILARKPNVFKSSSHLHFYDAIIYHCVFVNELREQKYDSKASVDGHSSQHKNFPGNYKTCVDVFLILWSLIFIVTGGSGSCNKKTSIRTDEENQHHIEDRHPRKSLPAREKLGKANQARAENGCAAGKKENINQDGLYPANNITCIQLFKFATKIILTILGVGFGRIKKIKVKKERHCHALEIMNKMIGHGTSYKYDNNGQRPNKTLNPKLSGGIDIPDKPPLDDELCPSIEPQSSNDSKETQSKSEEKALNGLVKKETPLLVAAKMGILEIVKKIISTCPVAIQDLDSKGKNVLMLAAEHRQTSVFDYLLEMNLPEHMFHQLDDEENNILHLAAKLGETQPWRIPGATLQMQWEIKWYKHVKGSVSSLSLTHHNKNGETPRIVMTKTHKELMKAGNDWLIKTSESCSVVAALIAAVAFATSATVPGGLDQNKGNPILENHNAFDVFSIASLVALCLAITSLVFFLAIITSRCEERDFKRTLPRKLLMGLTCLFSAIAAMLLSFCAGHTFILREKLRLAAVPIYAFATIPVAFFAMAQLPLYFDLLWASCRKVPLRSYKVNY